MSIDYHAVGRRIKELRKAAGKTQDDLAEALMVSVGYVSQVERGVTKASLETLCEIADYFCCDVIVLLTGTVSTQPDYLSEELQAAYQKMSRKQRNMLLEFAQILLKY